MAKKRRIDGIHYFDRPLGLLLIILYKVVWGLTELVSGVLLFFSYRLLVAELSEDPQDLLANWLLSHVHISRPDTVYLGTMFALFGLSKIVLGVLLWCRLRFVRPLGLIFFGLVGLYGLYHLSTHFSVVTLLVFALDMLSVFYFWKILPTHLTAKNIYE